MDQMHILLPYAPLAALVFVIIYAGAYFHGLARGEARILRNVEEARDLRVKRLEADGLSSTRTLYAKIAELKRHAEECGTPAFDARDAISVLAEAHDAMARAYSYYWEVRSHIGETEKVEETRANLDRLRWELDVPSAAIKGACANRP
jgi:hypothetical protein